MHPTSPSSRAVDTERTIPQQRIAAPGTVLGRAATGLVVATAVWIAAATYASAVRPDQGGAESAFLGQLAAIVLAALAVATAPWQEGRSTLGGSLLAGSRGLGGLPVVCGLAVVALLWIAPPGPSRGTAVTTLLVGAVTLVALRSLPLAARLTRGRGNQSNGRGADRPLTREAAAQALLLILLAIAAQALLRSDDLVRIGLDPRAPVRLLALPVAAGAALTLLARRFGLLNAALAGGLAFLLRPGLDVPVTLALVALAAGTLLRPRDDGDGARAVWVLRAGAILALVAPIVWEPRSGFVAVGCGALAAVAGTERPQPWMKLLVGLASLIVAVFFALRSIGEAMSSLLVVPFLLPALFATGLGLPRFYRSPDSYPGDRWWPIPPLAAGALLMAGAAALSAPSTAAQSITTHSLTARPITALAAPIALLVFAYPRQRSRDPLARAWGLLLFAGTMLFASYPWMQTNPLRELLAAVGLDGSLWSLVVLLVVFVPLVWIADPFRTADPESAARTRTPGRIRAIPLLLILFFGSLVWHHTTPPEVLITEPLVLGSETPGYAVTLAGNRTIGSLAVESHLANATSLPLGTPVATLTLEDPTGETTELILRAGRETAEWAARRPDVAAAAPFPPPPAWRSHLDPRGDFFGQRYRATWQLDPPVTLRRLRAERAAELPEGVEVVLFRLEVDAP